MAEKGAHLTQTTQIKPSIFDFVAQESLNDLLYPASKRIADVLVLRYPNLRGIAKWFDEIFLFNHFLLQLHYLKKYGATFSESFYGLQRAPIKQSSSRNALGRKELLLSLLIVTLFPYFKTKLSNLAERYYLEERPSANKWRRKYLQSVITANSGVHISLQIINFVQHLRYLSGKSDFNSPSLWAAGVKLQYADEEDAADLSSFSLRNFIPQMLRRSLEVSAFFLQFYQWWQTEQVGTLGALPIPPPPQICAEGRRFREICPICHQKRKIETALSVSGFVFCFPCIESYLRQHNKCPVTNLPATADNLYRIYPPQ